MTTLTKKAFVAWLQAKTPEEIVGMARTGNACPIAMFLGEWHEYRFVFEDAYRAGAQLVELPGWARNFVKAIDDTGDAVTAAQALEALGVKP
jgi:hypothetical protein